MRDEKGRFIKGYHPPTEFKKGHSTSREHRENLRKALLGNKNALGTHYTMTEEHREHIRQANLKYNPRGMKGKHHSFETIQKIKNNYKPHHTSTEFQCGNNHPNYKDGRSYEPYPPEFKKQRKLIHKHSTLICQDCGISEEEFHGIIDVHHKDGNKKNNKPENLVILCRTCHKIRHNKKKS